MKYETSYFKILPIFYELVECLTSFSYFGRFVLMLCKLQCVTHFLKLKTKLFLRHLINFPDCIMFLDFVACLFFCFASVIKMVQSLVNIIIKQRAPLKNSQIYRDILYTQYRKFYRYIQVVKVLPFDARMLSYQAAS